MINRDDMLDYFERSGDDYIVEGTLIQNDHGFMIYRVFKEEFCIMQAYGDGKYWDNLANELAKANGCKNLKFGTKRKPEGFCRKYGYKVSGYILTKEVG